MRNFFWGSIIFIFGMSVYADKYHCKLHVSGYKVVKNSVFSFISGKEKACFFAYYTINPDPTVDVKGNGNLGDTIWYAYYKLSHLSKIYELPKPADNDWSGVCNIRAISFYDMNGDNIPDITVIGACDRQNAVNHNFPLVFIWRDGKYVLDEDLYYQLYGFIALTVDDVRAYIKSPETYYSVLSKRYRRPD